MSESSPSAQRPLSLLSVVIPAKNEQDCIASTIEHLEVELRLQNVSHEIIVVDDGSTDRTWEVVTELQNRLPQLVLISNQGDWTK